MPKEKKPVNRRRQRLGLRDIEHVQTAPYTHLLTKPLPDPEYPQDLPLQSNSPTVKYEQVTPPPEPIPQTFNHTTSEQQYPWYSQPLFSHTTADPVSPPYSDTSYYHRTERQDVEHSTVYSSTMAHEIPAIRGLLDEVTHSIYSAVLPVFACDELVKALHEYKTAQQKAETLMEKLDMLKVQLEVKVFPPSVLNAIPQPEIAYSDSMTYDERKDFEAMIKTATFNKRVSMITCMIGATERELALHLRESAEDSYLLRLKDAIIASAQDSNIMDFFSPKHIDGIVTQALSFLRESMSMQSQSTHSESIRVNENLDTVESTHYENMQVSDSLDRVESTRYDNTQVNKCVDKGKQVLRTEPPFETSQGPLGTSTLPLPNSSAHDMPNLSQPLRTDYSREVKWQQAFERHTTDQTCQTTISTQYTSLEKFSTIHILETYDSPPREYNPWFRHFLEDCYNDGRPQAVVNNGEPPKRLEQPKISKDKVEKNKGKGKAKMSERSRKSLAAELGMMELEWMTDDVRKMLLDYPMDSSDKEGGGTKAT
ncbi:hypothetical protein Unana1_08716 [Umbelopsis nana]